MFIKFISVAFITVFLLNPSLVKADDDTSKDQRKQTLNFEDELVEGGTQKPDLFYLFQKKNFNYNRLIRLRENFLPEMRKNSEDVQRSRSMN
jgi:hypothetical protein